jgi:hypothetical protein
MKAVNIIIAAAIMMCCLWGTTAWGTLITYEYDFVPEQSEFIRSGGLLGGVCSYCIEGRFQLSVDFDAGNASFDWVDANISKLIWYYPEIGQQGLWTQDLNVIFHMTELESTYVSTTEIDFLLERNSLSFPLSDIHLSVTSLNDLIWVTGYFMEPVYDGHSYTLNATAVAVPEPGTLLLLAFGGIMSRRRS